ncbi:Pfs domain-containing protein [Fusarium mundagurra]|uniref:Pfs domain-containing protein n=1 Tax=Fusarium mundagurra TaxID=1567541 RepID=A0A8H5Z8A9_9HYPO|nr:Pfs domain-containing protein [Fusarium mundagurra]
MAALARAHRIHQFDDKICIKGYSTMLVPTHRCGDILCWHLLHRKDGGRLSYFANDLTQYQYVRSLSDLEHVRHVLGWCSKAEPFAGSYQSTCPPVAHSMLPKPDENGALARKSFSRGRAILKQSDYFLGARDTPPSLGFNDYVRRMQSLEAQFVLFWDETDKRGWLVNGASALLHAVESFLAHARIDGSRAAFLFERHESEKPRERHRPTALEILNDEKYQRSPLYREGDSRTILKTKIEELCGVLEYFIDVQFDITGDGALGKKPRKDLKGWDFEDLVKNYGTLYPRVATLNSNGKGWVDLIRAIKAVTLVGKGFGDIIRPAVLKEKTCDKWATLPKGQYYIATCVSDLDKVFKEHGLCRDGHLRLSDTLIWHSPTPGSEFCKCEERDRDIDESYHCEPVQTCFPLGLSQFVNSRENKMLDDNKGALIFGHHSQFPWIWGDFDNPTKSQLDEAPCPLGLVEECLTLSPDSGIESSMSISQVESQGRPRPRLKDSFAGPSLKHRANATSLSAASATSIIQRKRPVGIICALPIELQAVRALFDETFEEFKTFEGDSNCYFLGRIAHHHIVAACLPNLEYGTNAAASAAGDMKRSYNPPFCLLVGIGGGVPTEQHDIRLGDVVVGHSIVQYDLGSETGENFKIKDHALQSPPRHLRAVVSSLRSNPDPIGNSIAPYLATIFAWKGIADYRHQGHDRDVLSQSCSACRSLLQPCDHVRQREQRKDSAAKIHYGKIASGNRLIKDAVFRDQVAAKHDVICFEMEAAGIVNSVPCLVIRGISDYCDANKNDKWQEYAAATAAAYAKLLLATIDNKATKRCWSERGEEED